MRILVIRFSSWTAISIQEASTKKIQKNWWRLFQLIQVYYWLGLLSGFPLPITQTFQLVPHYYSTSCYTMEKRKIFLASAIASVNRLYFCSIRFLLFPLKLFIPETFITSVNCPYHVGFLLHQLVVSVMFNLCYFTSWLRLSPLINETFVAWVNYL